MPKMRSLGALALLLAGSTWLWLTPAYAGQVVTTSGVLWSITRSVSLLTVVGFCVATIGLLGRRPWWEGAALGSAATGLVALLPYWIAADRGGEPFGTSAWNVVVHVLMLAGVFTLLLVPRLERWVEAQVMTEDAPPARHGHAQRHRANEES